MPSFVARLGCRQRILTTDLRLISPLLHRPRRPISVFSPSNLPSLSYYSTLFRSWNLHHQPRSRKTLSVPSSLGTKSSFTITRFSFTPITTSLMPATLSVPSSLGTKSSFTITRFSFTPATTSLMPATTSFVAQVCQVLYEIANTIQWLTAARSSGLA